MQVHIHDLTEGGDTPRLRESAEERIRRAFDRCAGPVVRVELRLIDENGPKGGVDRTATLSYTLASGAVGHARANSEATLSAIDLAIGRAMRQLRNRSGRERSLRRRDDALARTA